MATTNGYLIEGGPSLGALRRAMDPRRKGTFLTFEIPDPKDSFRDGPFAKVLLEIVGLSHLDDPEYPSSFLLTVRTGKDAPVSTMRYNPHGRIGQLLT